MMTLFQALFVLLALKALFAEGAGMKNSSTDSFLEPQEIETNRKAISSNSYGKHISQAIFSGENEGTPLPWFARVNAKETELYCGGALVTERFVLTSAGCIYETSVIKRDVLKITLGLSSNADTSGRQVYYGGPSGVQIHPDFNLILNTNDIALVGFNTNADFNAFVTPIKIWTSFKDWTGEKATFAGWGAGQFNAETGETVYQTGLKYQTQEVKTKEFCVTHLKEYYNHKMHMCTANSGATGRADRGDGGGPLYILDTEGKPWLIGIISNQPTFATYEPGFPSKHIRLSKYLCWLDEKMANVLNLAEPESCTSGSCSQKRIAAQRKLQTQIDQTKRRT